jgi:hypothetical protein
MKWEVQISGDAQDLKELSNSLRDSDLRIFERNGQHFLESSRFDVLATSKEVSSLASDVLSVLTGAVHLSLGGRTPLLLANVTIVYPDGHRQMFITASEICYARDSAHVEITRSDGTVEVLNPADEVPGWVRLGLADPKVAKALRMLGTQEHDWVSLYRIYEVIEEDVGKIDNIVRYGWATNTSIKRFKHTANSPSAIGDASRHGKEPTSPPSDPMALSEARALVQVLLHNWLRWKTQRMGT